jgi:hypothetical protein
MNTQISVNPNPFTRIVQINIQSENKKDNYYILSLIDQKGKILRMLGVSLLEGNNKIDIDKLDDLPAGVYYLDIKNSDGEDIYNTRLEKE